MSVDALAGWRILVVEDDFFVSEALVALLQSEGATVLGPRGWVVEAVAFIEDTANVFDIAILDINLHGEKSYPVADALVARGISLVFATGYGRDSVHAAYRHHAMCTKPFDRAALMSSLGAATR